MRVTVCKNYDEVSKKASEMVAAKIILKPSCVLGLATGSTPVGMYKKLIEMNKNGKIDFSNVKTINLDEYYPMQPGNEQSYRYFMNNNLFDHINIDKKNTFVPNGMAKDIEKECAEYDARIDEFGIDIQILGIGQNGHIGFNEPDSALCAATHITGLTENTIEANSRFFDSADEVPKKAITMGMASILKAKTIVLLASGKAKHKAVKSLLDAKITTDVPATLLKVHSDVVLICDEDAYNG